MYRLVGGRWTGPVVTVPLLLLFDATLWSASHDDCPLLLDLSSVCLSVLGRSATASSLPISSGVRRQQ